jgi:hypothetical protein
MAEEGCDLQPQTDDFLERNEVRRQIRMGQMNRNKLGRKRWRQGDDTIPLAWSIVAICLILRNLRNPKGHVQVATSSVDNGANFNGGLNAVSGKKVADWRYRNSPNQHHQGAVGEKTESLAEIHYNQPNLPSL